MIRASLWRMKPRRSFSLTLIFSLPFATALATAEPLATVGERPISRATVEKAVANQLLELENTRYEILREGLDDLISETLFELEAKALGTTVEDLANKEIIEKVAEPTEEEIRALYEQQKAGLGDATLEDVRESAIDYLKQIKISTRHDNYIAELKKKYATEIALRPPKIEVKPGTRNRGAADAPITIVEFADYECPFCKRAEASVKKVIATYGDQVRLSYRDYPLSFHANARIAAEAGHCANAQGKFWEYHDKVMALGELSAEAINTVANEVGLEREKFDACLKNKDHEDALEADIAAAKAAGVNGTPVFFVNGRMLDGAQPFEAFRQVIEEELAWARANEKQ